jgi:hypothetical protein
LITEPASSIPLIIKNTIAIIRSNFDCFLAQFFLRLLIREQPLSNFLSFLLLILEFYKYENQIVVPKWFYEYADNGSIGDKLFLPMEILRFDDLVLIRLHTGVAIYWTLFTIWGTINAYHHKRFNIGWIMVFAIFNVLGYWVYCLVVSKVQ